MLSSTYSDSKIQIKTFIGLAPTPCFTCTLCIVCRHDHNKQQSIIVDMFYFGFQRLFLDSTIRGRHWT